MYKSKISNLEENIIQDIATLVAIPSVRDLSTAEVNAPFGKQIRLAMDAFMLIAESLGFKVKDHEGYAISAQLGDYDEYIGVLAHIDVVEAQEQDWISEAFKMDIRDGVMYGRGVNDDKGPLIGALYAAKIAYENVKIHKRSVRVIVGGAEETTWECMEYYFKHNPQPIFGFSPDGNFPIVNGEMGVMQLALRFKESVVDVYESSPRLNFLCHEFKVNGESYLGDKHLSRNPQRGKNAIDEYFNKSTFNKNSRVNRFISEKLNNDYKGERIGLALSHEEMLDLSVCMMSLNTVEDGYELCIDVRYPISITKDEILKQIDSLGVQYDFEVQLIKNMNPLFVSKNSELITTLQAAYQDVTGDFAQTLTKGGASYARVLDAGVAFGATFEGEDPRTHMSNEKMAVSSLLKATEIYAIAIEKLITK